MAEHRYERSWRQIFLPDYAEKVACSAETNTGTERTKLLATVAEASFQGDESALMAAVKFRDLPAHEIRIQCLVNWS
jgi:hypothetical protein